MPIIEYIQKLQQKSPSEKYRIAFFSSAGFTLVVFFVWLSLWHIEFQPDPDAKDKIKSITTPFETLSANVSGTYDDVRGQVSSFLSQEATSGLTH